ncbi:UDP-4-amino-4,6-dideoxy-N-acetyl-beta-L-altrosamine N-acetyltransferase [Sagittula sp. NFXS13]|uniref:UDP-4-amino-4, 6-dideoxy-N-acetyl-beta-L-altrosamine N-acetyltransferase n=1 Tax=Sagittula sp. NFXS13 TaxID=2819095 RepID=UPI0032DE8CA6
MTSSDIFGVLRPATEVDLGHMRAWRNHPAVRAMMYTQHEISADEHASWWARTQTDESAQYLIYERDGRPIGVVGVTQIDRRNGTANWAFYADPDAPRGSGSCMEYLALTYVFETLGLRKLNCEVLARNSRVLRMHLRFGFAEEGVFRDHVLIDGLAETVHRLAIFAEDWAKISSQQAAGLRERTAQ